MTDAPLSYAHTLSDLRSAAVVAVPLLDPYPLQGLTEIADAVACGKAVIVTRAPYFDFDIEAIGCGWWVERQDVDSWVNAIREAVSDRDRLAEMGERGRAWARAHWNADLFTQGVRRTLSSVVGDSAG
jgi:glycosyltransferase involved in cell wall biosynthesis